MDFRGKSIFLFEFITSGGFLGQSLDESLLVEGFAMLKSLIFDFLRLGFEINLILDYRMETKYNDFKNSLVKDEIIDNIDINKINAYFLKDLLVMNELLEDLIKRSDFNLIIAPEFNSTLLNLILKAENILGKSKSQKILGPDSKFIKLYSDKILSADSFKNLGYNTPETWSLDKFIEYIEEFKDIKLWWKYPPEYHKRSFIIKPVDGVGCLETFELELDLFEIYEYPKDFFVDLDNIFNRIKKDFPSTDFIIQNKKDGRSLSVSAIKRNNELSFLSINEQLIESVLLEETKSEIRFFKLEYIGGYSPIIDNNPLLLEAISTITLNVCKNYDFNGFFGLDFVFDKDLSTFNIEDSISLIEVNPRITTPYIAYSLLYKNCSENFALEFFKDNKDIKLKNSNIVCKFIKDYENGSMDIDLENKEDYRFDI